jgi:hypothetical protein
MGVLHTERWRAASEIEARALPPNHSLQARRP